MIKQGLLNTARIALQECMGLKQGEVLLVITDEPCRSVGEAFFVAGNDLGNESILVEIVPRGTHGEEPPACVAEMMKSVDVVVMPTSKSLSHTKARRGATKVGVRQASLPGITPEMMERGLSANYKEIELLSNKIAEILTKGKEVHLTSESGTDLYLVIEAREGKPDTGINHAPGSFSNLPAGEAYIAPVEGTANGVVVIDGSMAGVGIVEEPIVIKVQDGYAMEIDGRKEADKLLELLKDFDKQARNIAELGIGTNPKALLSGAVLEDEKVMGTVHIALGSNVSFGGSVDVPIHLDGVIKSPTLVVDGRVVMERGKIVI